MHLRVIDVNDSKEWDDIVRSFNKHDVYWLSGYVKAFELHGDGTPLLFCYEDDDARGINVVMKRDIALDRHFIGKIPKGEYFDFASPYGYGGWIIEGKEQNNLFIEYEKWCREKGVISEFVRFHPVLQNHLFCNESYEVIPLGNTITLDLSSQDIIWANITGKNRNKIRKAKKNGIKIYNGRYPQIFNDFKRIYDETMRKDNADEYYYFKKDFYESILMDLPQNSQIFYAEYEGKIIAASIILFENGYLNYHLSGSVKEYAHLAPSNLLLYEVALWGSINGYKSLYLGGGVGSGEDSLFKFKKAFYRNDDLFKFHIGKKIFIQEKYNKLLAMRTDIEDSFFPEYRA